uniref:Uncharacterized protein n=1 Tax=Ciona savignyi TaxID=51511 RepID=H2ZD89_CIOSA
CIQLASVNGPSGCDLFFDVHGQTTCEYTEVHGMIKSAKQQTRPPSTLFKQDHIYPALKSDDSTVILYGNIASLEFKQAHDLLKRLAKLGETRYILRHFIRARPDDKVHLSGYGVELAMKSTEYKAADDSVVKDDGASAFNMEDGEMEIDGFNFSTLSRNHPDMSKGLADLRKYLMESTNEVQPMKIWQMQDLSFQAAARVLNAEKSDQLKVLKDVSQNFPTRVRQQNVADELRNEIKQNQRHMSRYRLSPGDLMLAVNQRFINTDQFNLFSTCDWCNILHWVVVVVSAHSFRWYVIPKKQFLKWMLIPRLLDMLRSEGKLIDGLRKLNLNGNNLQKAMKLNVNPELSDKQILDIRDPSIIWVNDIESDEKYRRWPGNLHELLRPAFPGTLRRVRKNMFHLVFVVDPTHADIKYLVDAAEIFWANDVPVR